MKRIALLCCFIVFASSARAQQGPSDCKSRAKTAMEQAYCEIKAKDSSARLPNFREFRKNPEKTQRLLLRRPAKKAGIELPAAKPKQKKKRALAAGHPIAPPQKGLSEYCQLNKKVIVCSSSTYKLSENTPNHKLQADALLESSKLVLQPFAGNSANSDEVLPYIKNSYKEYVERMLHIGLGASTMSLTKFYHTFLEVESKKVSFSKRMQTMFEYLKKDKASIGVKARYNDLLPRNLDKCSALSQKLIVCDNVKQNWIYVLQ